MRWIARMTIQWGSQNQNRSRTHIFRYPGGTVEDSLSFNRTFLVPYNWIDYFSWFRIKRRNPKWFRRYGAEPVGFRIVQQKPLHDLALYGRALCGSELMDGTIHGFSTAMQNFKWFRKCCRNKKIILHSSFFFRVWEIFWFSYFAFI